MEEQTWSSARGNDDAPGSPKRKKVRAKYAPKACVNCRRSKLKCSGENPCQRCHDGGRRCIYSEDQTAAEALQSLSRPSPMKAPSVASSSTGPPRDTLARYDSNERRVSDTSVLNMPMEARMSRIENMMETLIHNFGVGATPRMSVELDNLAADGVQGENVGMDLFPVDLEPSRQHPSHDPDPLQPPKSHSDHSISISPSLAGLTSNSTIQAGSRAFAFPDPSRYQRYIDSFFANFNPYQPCVDETEFRSQSEEMLRSGTILANRLNLLALNYLIFACVDIAYASTDIGTFTEPPGWEWYQISNELIARRKLTGQADLHLIQSLIFEVLFLSYADLPYTAYSVTGLACRLCFQLGLHRQSSLEALTPFDKQMRHRVFWTVYIIDRRMAITCGKPYEIRDHDVDMEPPSWICKADLDGQDQPDPSESRSSNTYVAIAVAWAKLAGNVWDFLFASTTARGGVGEAEAGTLDAKITEWTVAALPTVPFLPGDRVPNVPHQTLHMLVYIRFNLLRLTVYRDALVTQRFSGVTGRRCGELAIDTLQRIRSCTVDGHVLEPRRWDFAVALGAVIATLSALILRGLRSIGLEDQQEAYLNHLTIAVERMSNLTTHFELARRLANDMREMVQAVSTIMDNSNVSSGVPMTDVLFPCSNLVLTLSSRPLGTAANEADDDMDTAIAGKSAKEYEPQKRAGGYGVPWI